MNSQDWYRRALGGVRRAGPGEPAPGTYVPQSYVGPQSAPPTYVPPGYRLVPDQEPGTVSWQQLHGQIPNVDTRTIPRGAVTAENFHEMAKFWRGGQGRQAALSCPECGGVLFRRFEGRREAAPLCEQCGYNGLFTQGQGAVAVN